MNADVNDACGSRSYMESKSGYVRSCDTKLDAATSVWIITLPSDPGQETLRICQDDVFPSLIEQQDTNGECERNEDMLDWYTLGLCQLQHKTV